MVFDETELEINLHGYGIGAWSILASHAPRSFRVCGKTHDSDIIRLPVALPNKQATTMRGALCTGEGLWPGLSEIKAKVRAILASICLNPEGDDSAVECEDDVSVAVAALATLQS